MKYRRGWFGENYRHYLASKGVSSNRYFVRHELKGNRGSSLLHSLYSRGYSNPDIANDPSLPTPVRNEAISKMRRKKTSTLIDVPERAGGDAPSTAPSSPFVPSLAESASFTPISSAPVPSVELSQPQAPQFQPQARVELGVQQIDSASSQEGIAPVEGFEEPEGLSTSEELSGERTVAPTMTPGVPELPSFGMVNNK